jgi:arylsulfatase A-like enzyme
MTNTDPNRSLPNILFLLVDDMGYGDVAAHGNPVIQTPHFDRLHHESVRMERFCVSPTCAPTRAALMSGLHEFGADVTHTITGRNQLHLETTTVAELLKTRGYATGLFGKWHLGTEGPYRPEYRGFDTALTCIGDTQQHHMNPVLLRNGMEEQHQGYRTDIFFQEAMRFVEEHRDEPFFCMIPTYSPHTPLVVPEEWSDLYPDATGEHKRFMGMVSNVDDNLGRMREHLDRLGLTDNTIVVAMNDNGGTWGVDVFNGGMRGRKSHTLYGGIRAFSYWCWPGTWEPGPRNQTTGHVDVLPTFAALTGAEPAEVAQRDRLEGLNLQPLLESGSESDAGGFQDRMMVHHRARWNDLPGQSQEELRERHKYAYCCVRWRHYLLMRVEPCDHPDCLNCQQIHTRCRPGGPPRLYTNNLDHYTAPAPGVWQLYDLEEDLFQERDIGSDHPEVVEAMSTHYERWWEGIWEVPSTLQG